MALLWLPVLPLLYLTLPGWLVVPFALVALWSVVRAYRQVWLWTQDQRYQHDHYQHDHHQREHERHVRV
ncbi:hypothetical protein [Kineococcus sp. SYSU DK002]|uniref:hypothetical protein n=1 Tax=Kineococcus sp. SYSU DK002 TaxID=3383123 RepID=UPI003D7E4E31